MSLAISLQLRKHTVFEKSKRDSVVGPATKIESPFPSPGREEGLKEGQDIKEMHLGGNGGCSCRESVVILSEIGGENWHGG